MPAQKDYKVMFRNTKKKKIEGDSLDFCSF